MRTRTLSNPPPGLDENESSITWHSLHCELITPMYGGGVKSTIIDKDMPIRATGIRGQLRFWWRLLAKQKWYPDAKERREKEFALWGGANIGSDEGKAGLVLLRVKTESIPNIEPWAEYKLNYKNKLELKPKPWADLLYALFPAQGKLKKHRTEVDEYPHELLHEGFQWVLEIAFAPNVTNKQKEQAWESIRWWANFGGVGSRTRRGLGAIKVRGFETIEIEERPLSNVVNSAEIEALRLKTKQLSNCNNPYSAWKKAVEKLETFRQVGKGRNNHSSRSHWPEPDAIRKITKQWLDKTDKKGNRKTHKKRKTAGDIFPRAAFGLPIIFKFKDGGDNSNNDPKTTTLTAKYKLSPNQWIDFERLTSPLILRPYLGEDGNWHALAMCLPEQLGNNPNIQLTLDGTDVDYFDANEANDVTPLKVGQQVLAPLDAFLNYFER